MNHGLNYSSYLQLENILSNQILQSGDIHDEMLFIIIHQAYELWFKQIIHEGKSMISNIENGELFSMLHKLKRIRMIFKLIVSQVDILETMHPDSFASFRKYLGTASGFQSKQFREIEALFGIEKQSALKSFSELYLKDNIWISFLKHCIKNVEIKENDNNEFNEIESLLLNIYHKKSLYTEIMEMFLDIDEGIQEWRYRHLKLVERIIGFGTQGTGGSEGFEYLKNSLSKSFCRELWSIRSIIFNSEDVY